MKRLRHPYLVRYMQATEKKQSELRIYMEYAAGGSLSARLARAGALSLPLVKRYTRQLCEALQYLHRHGIAHRDIKCANIFLTASDLDTCSNALADVKLGDFGTFKEVGCASLVGGLKGTPHWMAPEVIRQQHLDGENSEGWFRADVWSLGCAILEMITGHSPWQQYSNPLTAMYQIVCSDVTPTIPADASEETASFLKLCLQRNPAHRATVAQLLEHAFVRVATDIMSKTTTNPSKRYTKRKSPDASKHTVVGSNQQAILSLPPKITTRNGLARSPEDSVMQPRAPIEGRGGLNEELKPRVPGLEGRRRGEKNQASTPRHVCEIRSGLTDMEPSGKPKSTRAAR
ncbi:hypothetical protein BBJ28_00016640 [Nothophytophthora sp. Chile5]|nr:hypothetical protein BBJ28_00016640 [Nothophytophthora sp. Chile5]